MDYSRIKQNIEEAAAALLRARDLCPADDDRWQAYDDLYEQLNIESELLTEDICA